MHQASTNVWRRYAEPSGAVKWMGHALNRELNCLLEEVVLKKECETCAIITPFGSLAPLKHNGSYSQHQMTLVSKNLWQKDKPCQLHQVLVGTNSNITTLTSGNYRLRSDSEQTDFLIRPRLTDPVGNAIRNTLCGQNQTFYDVLGMAKVVAVLIAPLTTEKLTAARKELGNTSEELRVTIQRASYSQYTRDVVIDQENVLVVALQHIQCEMRRTNFLNAVATSQYNGWLAASLLQQPSCYKLRNIGHSVQIIQCRAREVTFSEVSTKCGHQPSFEESTISITGWELTRFTPCYYTTNFIDFNGITHHFVDGDWEPIVVDFMLTESKLLPTFAISLDNTFNYSSKRNPGSVQDSIEHVSIIADIIAQIHEVHTSGAISTPQVSEVLPNQELNHFSKWINPEDMSYSTWFKVWNVIKWITIITVVLIAILPLLYITWKIYKWCRRVPFPEELRELPRFNIPMTLFPKPDKTFPFVIDLKKMVG